MGVWEPLLEPLEDETRDGFRPWRLELRVLTNIYVCTGTFIHTYILFPNFVLGSNQMKKKPVKFQSLSDEVDCIVPDYKTVIVISSKDQLNITLSKCGLAMLTNLGTVKRIAAIILT